MSLWFFVTAHLFVLAYAFVGGVTLAFSDFIMRSLAASGNGPHTMQVINREVFRWIFMTLFLGLAPLSLGLAGYGAVFVGGPSGTLLALGGLAYFIGCFGVTVCFNVPMNNRLAALPAGTPEATHYWTTTYLPRWTFWNSVRTAACGLASACVLLALTLPLRGI